jgi:hypothetical protein
MQYKDNATGTWHTYAVINQLGRAVSSGKTSANINAATGSFGGDGTGDSFQIFDPRTDRFGLTIPHLSLPGALGSYTLNGSIRPTAISGRAFMMGWGAPTSGFAYNAAPNGSSVWFYPGDLTKNLPTSDMRYTDVDGVLRAGDGAYATTTLPDGNPLIPGTAYNTGSQRPIVLNRAFRSVGELGYAFRDLPFKSIDFFTDDSADAALLDIFSVEDAPVLAAKVNLNTATLPVLKALIKGGLKKETDASQLLDADVNGIASSLLTQLAANPMMNRGDLVKYLGSNLTPLLSTSADKSNKTQREAVVRSLAEVTDARTWNLMIDVVAQAGRFSPQAATLDAFTVEGEKRYWLHIALDRFTGKIISSRLEPVYE